MIDINKNFVNTFPPPNFSSPKFTGEGGQTQWASGSLADCKMNCKSVVGHI